MDLGQVFTGETVAGYMAAQFSCKKDARILEPCFGGGAFLKACRDRGYLNVEGCEIDAELFDAVKPKYPCYKLFRGDFLSFSPGYRYDGIIMNPPYVRQEKIDQLEGYGITKKNIRENPIYNGLPGTANLYMYFLIKAADLLCENGELIVIFPSSWMQARGGESFRRVLLAEMSIVKEVHVSGDVFEKNALVDVVILKMVKGKKGNLGHSPVYMELKGKELSERNGWTDDMAFSLNRPFQAYSRIRRGLTTGWNAMFINPPVSSAESRRFQREILSTPKAVTGYNTDSAETDRLLMISPGETPDAETAAYLRGFERQLEEKKTPKALYEKAQRREEWYALKPVDSDGILFSYFVRNDMKFVMNTANVLARDNFYILYPKIDKYLMFALLNNHYTYYQLETMGKKYGAGLLKLQRYDIENLKFADIDRMADGCRDRLASLAKELAQSSDPGIIGNITRLLSEYTGTDPERIIQACEDVKRKRLEAYGYVR